MFSMVDSATEAVVGSCAFKGPPEEGIVEIAYGVEQEYQNRGYATEAAQALVEFCKSRIGVNVVRAHTLSANLASTRVIEKAGFAFIGKAVDPEDGPVNRWEIAIGKISLLR
jgi:RimJ/RimL family protein N-acetyltransferase